MRLRLTSGRVRYNGVEWHRTVEVHGEAGQSSVELHTKKELVTPEKHAGEKHPITRWFQGHFFSACFADICKYHIWQRVEHSIALHGEDSEVADVEVADTESEEVVPTDQQKVGTTRLQDLPPARAVANCEPLRVMGRADHPDSGECEPRRSRWLRPMNTTATLSVRPRHASVLLRHPMPSEGALLRPDQNFRCR